LLVVPVAQRPEQRAPRRATAIWRAVIPVPPLRVRGLHETDVPGLRVCFDHGGEAAPDIIAPFRRDGESVAYRHIEVRCAHAHARPRPGQLNRGFCCFGQRRSRLAAYEDRDQGIAHVARARCIGERPSRLEDFVRRPGSRQQFEKRAARFRVGRVERQRLAVGTQRRRHVVRGVKLASGADIMLGAVALAARVEVGVRGVGSSTDRGKDDGDVVRGRGA
jgi:hypothetical protein